MTCTIATIKRATIKRTMAASVFAACAVLVCAGDVDAAPNYAALEKLPDIAGDWYPTRAVGAPQPQPPLRPEAQAEVKRRQEMSAKGRPYAFSASCLPAGGQSLWSGPNGVEIVLSPSKVFVWGRLETDGNYLMRAAIDGRPHSPDPDPTFLGESVGHWEGDTLVIDTIAFLPEVPAASNIANDGEMHTVTRLRLTNPDTLQMDMDITAPKVLTQTWRYSATYTRRRGEEFEAKEFICLQNGVDKVDEEGYQYLDTDPPADVLEALKSLPSN